MALSTCVDDGILNAYQLPRPVAPSSPMDASTASSTPSSTFSVDAPSSHSSISSSSGWSSSRWHLENGNHAGRDYGLLQRHNSMSSEEDYAPSSVSSDYNQKHREAIAPQSRVHPRRTQPRLNTQNLQDGQHMNPCPRPPPSLIRQSERKDNFVDSLVDTTTQMIETIWPLSVLSCGRDVVLGAKQQNLLGLRTFVQEVLKRSKTSYSTLQVALYYLILIQSCMPRFDFTMEQMEDSSALRALQCGRRMFLAALILASKYLQDRNFSARAWSKISGLRTCEINTNEMAFLSAVNWKLHMPEATFQKWTDIVLKYSPSSQVNSPPRSSPTRTHTWRSLIPLLTPDLDTVDLFGSAEVAYDSGYDSAGSDESVCEPPPLLQQGTPVYPGSDATTPKSHVATVPVCEASPGEANADGHIMPPSLHLGHLPTPQFTPQTGAFATPAVSVSGFTSRRPSMSYAMAEIRRQEFARTTLDNPSEWRLRCPQSNPSSNRRSSLARSASSVSSPESVLLEARPSRSSSISSVASSNSAALPQPRLAVQATRRCATMQLGGLKEEGSRAAEPTQGYGSPAYPIPCPRDLTHEERHEVVPAGTRGRGGPSQVCNRATHEAATALRDLALNNQQQSSSPSKTCQTTPRAVSSRPLKRSRPTSIDLSSTALQTSVRDLLTRSNVDGQTVLSDENAADSFLLRGKESTRAMSRSSLEMSKQPKPSICREGLPRKRTCAGSDRGGKAEARMYERSVSGPYGLMPWEHHL